MANDLNIVYKIAADITGLQSGVNRAAKATEGLQSAVSTLGVAVAGAFTVTAVVGFGKALIADADALVKLHDKTGLAFQALQKFQIAGDDAGNTLDQLTSAVSQMQNRLAGGDASAVAALEKLGLSLAYLKTLSPEGQFTAISDAIRKIQDPAQQVNIAMDLFGRQGAEILPTLKRGFDDLKDASVGMSDQTVKNLDAVGDALTKFSRELKGTVANAIVDFADLASHGFSIEGVAQERAVDALKEKLEAHRKKLLEIVAANEKAAKAVLGFVGPLMDEATALKVVTEATDKREKAQQKATESLERATRAEQDYQAQRAFDAFVREAEAANELAEALDNAAREFSVFVEEAKNANAAFTPLLNSTQVYANVVVPDVTSSMGDMRRMTQGAETDLGDLAEAFSQLAQIGGDSFSGIVKGIGQMIGAINLAQAAMDKMSSVSRETGAVINKSIASNISGFVSWIGWVQLAGAAMQGLANIANKKFDLDIPHERAMQQISNFAQLVEILGTLEEAMQKTGLTAEQIMEAMRRAFDARTPAEFAAAVRIINDALAATRQLEDDLRAGGFLSQDELLALAKRAQNVYDTIAEGVKTGKYTQEQAEQAFRKFMEALAAAGDAAAKAWLEANKAAGDAATTAETATTAQQKALDALISKRDSLAKSLEAEAPEEVMGVIETQMRGELAALDAEIAAQRKSMDAAVDETTNAMGVKIGVAIEEAFGGAGDAADGARSDIEGEFAGLEIKIPYSFYQVGPGPGAPPAGPSADRTFGRVLAFQPTRTAPSAALAIGPDFARAAGLSSTGTDGATGGGGGDTYLTVQSILDGHVIAENQVKLAAQDKRGIGTKWKRALGVSR